jgi:hypothetical protein
LALYDRAPALIAQSGSESYTSPRIYTQVIERNTALRIRWDGSQQATTAITPPDNGNQNTSDSYYVGAYGNSTGTGPLSGLYFNGDIAQVVVLFTSSFSTSVLKRLEHTAAFSFKIACN